MKTLILTAIPVEYKAIREYLVDLQEIETPDGTIFENGTFNDSDHQLEIIIGQCGVGNISSAIYTERAIKTINPSLVIFCGIAGGIKDVKIGDVVVASKIYSYEGLKDQDGMQSRPDGYKCTYAIVQRALYESTTNNFISKKSNHDFKVFVGPICVGEKVLADNKSDLFKFIKSHYNDSLAVEMESMGFLGAAYSNNFEYFTVIRGISDLLVDKEFTDTKDSQAIASSNSAKFTFFLLSKIWKNIKPRIPRAIGIKLSFEETLGDDQIENVLKQISQITGDMNIKIENITYGSTNIYIKMSETAYNTLKIFFSQNNLKDLLDYNPISIKQYLSNIIDGSSSKGIIPFRTARKSVIIYEDDPLLRKIFETIFDKIQDEYDLISSFEEPSNVLHHIFLYKPNIIILNINHQYIEDGLIALCKIKNDYPQTKVMVLTMMDSDDLVLKSICLGADGYILKSDWSVSNLPHEEIRKFLNIIFDGGASLTPSVAKRIMRLISNHSLQKRIEEVIILYKRKVHEDIKYSTNKQELTEMQISVLEKVEDGKPISEIAKEFALNEKIINKQIKSIYVALS